jgi:hypothetical protein
MKDSSAWRTPALGPHADRAAPGRATNVGRSLGEAADAHALQRERVVASVVLHPHPRKKGHASGR